MDISIVTPVYKTPVTFLEELYRSILEQQVEWEWIVVNNGVVDDPGSTWLRGLPCVDQRVRYYEEGRNAGACRARNYGLSLAIAPLVKFVDSDDWLGEGQLYKELVTIRRYHCDLVVTVCNVRDSETGAILRRHDAINEDAPLSSAIRYGYGSPGAILFSTERSRSIGGWNEQLLADQDGDFYARYISGGVTLKMQMATAFNYREHHGARVGSARTRESLLSRIQAMTWIEESYVGVDDISSLRRAKQKKWARIARLALSFPDVLICNVAPALRKYGYKKVYYVVAAWILTYRCVRQVGLRRSAPVR